MAYRTVQSCITDATGQEIPLSAERDPRAAFHFAQVGRVQDGVVWRCSAIHGQHLEHRLTFTSYYSESAERTWGLGRLLFHEMCTLEATARWEAELATQQLAAA